MTHAWISKFCTFRLNVLDARTIAIWALKWWEVSPILSITILFNCPSPCFHAISLSHILFYASYLQLSFGICVKHFSHLTVWCLLVCFLEDRLITNKVLCDFHAIKSDQDAEFYVNLHQKYFCPILVQAYHIRSPLLEDNIGKNSKVIHCYKICPIDIFLC